MSIPKIIGLTILFAFSHGILEAQTIYFNKLYDENSGVELASSVVELDSGGYVFVGDILDPYRRIILRKVDKYGEPVWTSTIGDSNHIYFTNTVLKLPNGYAVTGSVKDSVGAEPDMVLVRFDLSGDTLWSKRYGGAFQEHAYDSKQTSDGGFILAGVKDFFGLGNNDFYVVKTDSLGNLEWDTTYGGSGNDVAFGIDLTYDGGYVISGTSNSFGPSYDGYLVKTDADGNQLFDRSFGSNEDDNGVSVTEVSDSGYVSAGALKIDNIKRPYIIKYNKTGQQQWERHISFEENASFTFNPVEDTNGDLFAAGFIVEQGTQKGLLAKFNSEGDSLWTKIYSTGPELANYFWDIIISSEGMVLCGTGISESLNSDMWLVKLDSLGNTCEPVGCDSVSTGYSNPVQNENRIEVFPNPFSESTTFFFGRDIKDVSIQIFDLPGQVQHWNIEFRTGEILVKRKSSVSGRFFYRIHQKGKTISRGKLVVVK